MTDKYVDSENAFVDAFFDMDFEVFEDFNVNKFSFPDAPWIACEIRLFKQTVGPIHENGNMC